MWTDTDAWSVSDMRMPDDDLKSTFAELTTRIRDSYPDLAYLHVIQPGIDGSGDQVVVGSVDSDAFLRDVWGARPYLAAGGFDRESAIERADETGNLIAFGRWFISNVSLVCCF